jgi:hypothetical protein
MLSAMPQLNGNSEQDFEAAYVALCKAMEAVESAARVISGNILHGRNYQHLGDQAFDILINEKRRVHAKLTLARSTLGEVQSDISDILA